MSKFKKTFLPMLVGLSLSAPLTAASQTVYVRCSDACVHSTYREVYEYDFVDEKPTFPGGDTMLLRYINRTRQYPKRAYRKGIQGRVTLSFVVNADGSVSAVAVLRGVEKSLNTEAARIISDMPHWSPGRIDGKAVPVRVIQTVVFRK